MMSGESSCPDSSEYEWQRGWKCSYAKLKPPEVDPYFERIETPSVVLEKKYHGPPRLSGPKYTDHTHYSLEKYSFYPWIIFLGTNPRWSFNLISLAAERKNSIIIFLFWNHIFWTNLNKYAIVARRKEKKLWKKFARVCDRMNT